MSIAVVGSGGKTTLIKKLASGFRREGKSVLVTTTIHMFIQEDTLLTDDADTTITVSPCLDGSLYQCRVASAVAVMEHRVWQHK